jgi:hypothetical protein
VVGDAARLPQARPRQHARGEESKSHASPSFHDELSPGSWMLFLDRFRPFDVVG